jgi:hypothetical protein
MLPALPLGSIRFLSARHQHQLPRIGAALKVLLSRMPGVISCAVDRVQSSIPEPVFPGTELFQPSWL